MATSVVGQLRPKWQELSAKASELEAAKRAEREARAAVDDQNKRLRPIVDALRPLNEGTGRFGLDRGRCVAQDSGRPGGEDSPARPGTPGSQVKPRPGQRLQPVSLEQRTYGLLSQPSGSG